MKNHRSTKRDVYKRQVPDLILHNEHPKLLELLSELLDVIADEAIIHLSLIHI